MSALVTDLDVRRAYSADVSGLVMMPDAVSRPASEAEVVDVLDRAVADRTPVTPAGGQTSTTGASIAERGILLSTRGMNRVIEIDAAAKRAIVEPGVLLADLNATLAEQGLLFAPDPTSLDSVTVGGAIACNASGARSYRYGPTRNHVTALRVALAGGTVQTFARSGLEKNTVGYALAQEPVDWFIGSEGTLGVITQAELALRDLPRAVVGLAIPCHDEAGALRLAGTIREHPRLRPRCIEYFDESAVTIARETGGAPWRCAALLYTEYEPADDDDLDTWLRACETGGAIAADIAVLEGEAALRDARRFRHSVPATMNERGARRRSDGGRKVSTDWAVPYRALGAAVMQARRIVDAAGLPQPVIYGHAGNGHPHQNFIARDADDVRAVETAVEETLRHVLSLGGTVAAEHGIGKLKRRWLPLQASDLQIGVMRAVKRELDPFGLMAPGNVL